MASQLGWPAEAPCCEVCYRITDSIVEMRACSPGSRQSVVSVVKIPLAAGKRVSDITAGSGRANDPEPGERLLARLMSMEPMPPSTAPPPAGLIRQPSPELLKEGRRSMTAPRQGFSTMTQLTSEVPSPATSMGRVSSFPGESLSAQVMVIEDDMDSPKRTTCRSSASCERLERKESLCRSSSSGALRSTQSSTHGSGRLSRAGSESRIGTGTHSLGSCSISYEAASPSAAAVPALPPRAPGSSPLADPAPAAGEAAATASQRSASYRRSKPRLDGGGVAVRAQSEPRKTRVRLPQLMGMVTLHLNKAPEPKSAQAWKEETVQLELFKEELGLLVEEQEKKAVSVSGPEVPQKRHNIGLYKGEQDLRWARQQLRQAEQEYQSLLNRMSSLNPHVQGQQLAALSAVEQDIEEEKRRQKQMDVENKQRGRTLARDADERGDMDGNARALKQIASVEAEAEVLRLKSTSLQTQVDEEQEHVANARQSLNDVQHKAQRVEKHMASETMKGKISVQREHAERMKEEEAQLRQAIAAMQESRQGAAKAQNRAQREAAKEVADLRCRRKELDTYLKGLEAVGRQWARQLRNHKQGLRSAARLVSPHGPASARRHARQGESPQAQSPPPAHQASPTAALLVGRGMPESAAAPGPQTARSQRAEGEDGEDGGQHVEQEAPGGEGPEATEEEEAEEKGLDANGGQGASSTETEDGEPAAASAEVAPGELEHGALVPDEGEVVDDVYISSLQTHVEQLLGPGPRLSRLCVLGSTAFYCAESEELTGAIAREMGTRLGDFADFLLGGMAGVQAVFAQECDAAGGERIWNLLPEGQASKYGVGTDIVAGRSLDERRSVFSRIGDVYLVIEGGPGVSKEAREAIGRGAAVLPLPRTGGACSGMYDFPASALRRPEFATPSQWEALCRSDVSVAEAAVAAADTLEALLALATRRDNHLGGSCSASPASGTTVHRGAHAELVPESDGSHGGAENTDAEDGDASRTERMGLSSGLAYSLQADAACPVAQTLPEHLSPGRPPASSSPVAHAAACRVGLDGGEKEVRRGEEQDENETIGAPAACGVAAETVADVAPPLEDDRETLPAPLASAGADPRPPGKASGAARGVFARGEHRSGESAGRPGGRSASVRADRKRSDDRAPSSSRAGAPGTPRGGKGKGKGRGPPGVAASDDRGPAAGARRPPGAGSSNASAGTAASSAARQRSNSRLSRMEGLPPRR